MFDRKRFEIRILQLGEEERGRKEGRKKGREEEEKWTPLLANDT